jgi:hypothetical protein
MLVKDARVATPQQAQELLKKIIGVANYKKTNSYNYCVKNAETLKKWYTEFYDLYRQKKYKEYFEDQNRIYLNSVERFKNQTNEFKNAYNHFEDLLKNIDNHCCTCGEDLRYVESYGSF